MANKVTIDELVTKYLFEVDDAGQKQYEESLKKGAETAEKAAETETKARKATSAEVKKLAEETRKAQEKAAEKGAKAIEKAITRGERAQTRAAKRGAQVVERASARVAAARARASAAAARGDARGAKIAIAETRRAEIARTAAVRRGARAQTRIERRAQRRIRLAHRRTTQIIRTEATKQARAVRRANRATAAKGRVESAKKFAGALQDVGKAAAVMSAAIVVATGATVAFVDSQTQALDTIAKQAQQFGLGAEEYQRLAFAAERSGASIEVINDASKTLQVQLLDLAQGGGGALVAALAEVGLSADDIKGKSFEEQLSIISDAMNLTLTDTEKMAVGAKLFG
jgi:hypothetical protein